MAQKWKDVRKPLSPEAEKRIQQGVQEAAAVMTMSAGAKMDHRAPRERNFVAV